MLENKLHISNKSSIAIKLSLLVAILIASAVFIVSVLPVFADGSNAIIWTTDYSGNDKTDFEPSEIVYIHGTGFNPVSQIDISIIRPDSVTESCNAISCNLRFLNGLQTSNEEGDLAYNYNLNGITGIYTVDMTDGTNSAQTTFTDDRAVNWVTLNGGDQWTPPSPSSNGDSVTIAPSATITIVLTVTTDDNSDWLCTSWDIEGPGNSGSDNFEPDHTSNGQFTETFVITAPNTPGIYDLMLQTRSNDACTSGSSGSIVLTNAIVVQAQPVCGDGIINGNDICDDGNTANGDGCSNACVIESGWTCSGQPSVCKTINPTLSSSCGIDIALIIDNSGSISDTELTQMKNAFKAFVDAFLPYTPTQMVLVKFNTNGDLVLDYNSDATTIKNAIDSVSTSSGYTNWQDGLKEAYDEFDNSAKPDLYVFASDGNPNRYGDPAQTVTEPVAVAQAVLTANQIKLSGIRIITLGIGLGTGGAANLQAISSADAYYSTGFGTLAQTLATLADDLCGGTITVKKLVDSQPASGWIFDASATGGAISPTISTTGIDGFINPVFDIEIPGSSATASVSENLNSGHIFVSASCVNQNQQSVGSCSAGTCTGITVGKNDAIYCEFKNTHHECESHADCIRLSGPCADGICNAQNQCEQQFKSDQTICRASQGLCDLEEKCTGSSAACPADAKSTDICKDAAGDCDIAETCDGKSNECPADIFLPYTVQCRASAGKCDLADYCTGQSATCVNDVKSTALCRESTGQCDVDEYCDGQNNNCPADAKAKLSTPCNDGLWCSATDHCDGNGICVKLTDQDCSGNNIIGITTCDWIPDDYHPTWDFRNAFTSVCVEDSSNQGHCTTGDSTITHTCDYINCNAQCDATHACKSYCMSNIFFYDGQCQENCMCYYSQQNCDDQISCTIDSCDNVAGCSHTPDNSLCDDANPCTIDTCDVSKGCVNTFSDTTGPTTSNLVANPYYNNGIFDATALATDTCSNIKKSEYFLGHGLGSCGFAGTGTPMDATDGSFDELIEDVKKDNVQYYVDGLNYICVQSQDVTNNWGNCVCAYFETDILPPDCPYDIYLDKQLNPNEYLICGNNAWVNATICDQQSRIQGGEYFVDITIPPVPAPWSGIWMNTLYNFTRADAWKCAVIGAQVDASKLSDGTHYIKIRGKDTAENWGKITECPTVSFIRDILPPETTKTLIPSEKQQHECSADEITGAVLPNELTNGCQFVKGGTQVVLHATDPDPQGTDEHADKTKISWIVWYKVNPEDQWVIDQQGVGNENQDVTITLDKDSYHLIEYWSVDGCSWEETHHFELDIVDNKVPVTTKTIGEPKISYSAGEWYITQQTPIELSCADQNPHPVDHVTLYARYNVDGGNWVDLITKDGYVKFTFTEDSIHTLEWYCEDALGNKELTSTEIDRVDTTYPDTVKTYGTPLVEAVTGGYPKWITLQTPITLTATDGGKICAIGVSKTYWRNTVLASNEACENPTICQEQTGIGSFNEYTVPFYKPEESCHLIEYYSVDSLGNTEPIKKQCVYVENTPPQIVKTVDTPKHECTLDEKTQYGNPDYGCWYITQNTKITLDCDDVMPHPVDNVVLYYRDYLLGEQAPSYTAVQGGYVDIYKTEDSEHVLEFYCVDALGNSQGTAETPHKEIDIVDTQPPVSQKDLGTPKHACTEEEAMLYYRTGIPSDGCYFITQNTPITLTCADGQPHPVDHVEIWYRDYLVSQEAPRWTVVEDDHVTFYKSEDSAHILEWYCVDELGNTERLHIEYDIVETQPPITTKTILGPQYFDEKAGKFYIDGKTEIELTCKDSEPHPVDHEVIYYRYRVDDGNWPTTFTEYTGAFKFPEESKHELEYYCVDALGNEERHQFEIDYVDHTSPVTTKTYGRPFFTDGVSEWITSQTPITLTADDGTSIHSSGVKETYWRNTLVDDRYCTDQSLCQEAEGSGEWNIYETPFYKPEQSCHLIEYYSVDNVDKTETVKKQCVYVENTPPVVDKIVGNPKVPFTPVDPIQFMDKYDIVDPMWYVTQNTLITLTCEDQQPHPVDNVEIYYKIYNDGQLIQDWAKYTAPFTYSEDTYHELYYYCVDALGNKGSVHVEYDIVDTLPPVSQKNFKGVNIPCSELKCANEPSCDYYITQDTEIYLTCEDQQPHPVDNVKIYYRYFVDDVLHKDWALYEGPIKYDEDSKHTLDWYCVDALGNIEGTHTQIERVDSTPPVTTKTVGNPKYGNDDYWVTSQTPITLTTLDNEIPCASGPATLYYEVWWDSNCDGTINQKVQDGSTTTDSNCKLEKTIYLNEECLHEIRWHAVDALGNVEQEHTQLHKVDNTPPHVLILKPVDGWYSDGEDISIVSIAEDLTNPHTPCTNPLSGKCAVGIEDGRQCYAYLIDLLPEFNIVELNTEGTFLYNAEAHECQGYATIPSESGIPDGVVLLAISADDNLGNMGNSLQEIYHAIMMTCGEGPAPECIMNVVQDIITIWNLPKIGIDNHAPEVIITTPIEGTLFGGEQVYFSADVIDSNDGDVTSTITSGTPCYVTVGGISLGIVPYNNENRKCVGTIMIPEDTDFPQGTQPLKVEIADNAGNLGSDTVDVNVDTISPLLAINVPSNNQFVSGIQLIKFSATDTNLDVNSIKVSTDNGQTWKDVYNCGTDLYCYDWDTTQETDGMAYGIITKATDLADNTGHSEVVIVIVDNGSPEGVYVVDPVKNDIVEGTITLKALATDYVSGVESVKIYVESIAWYCDATLTDGTWQCPFDSTILLDGNHEVYAVATDNLGQTTTSARVSFIVDNHAPTAPVISVSNPDGDGYDTDGTVTWSWTSSTNEGSGVAYYEFMASDKPGDVITKLIGNFFTTSDLIDGTYVAKVRGVDMAGHAGDWSNEVDIIVDKTKPSPIYIWTTDVENLIYDTDGNYELHWNGGSDNNFDRYDIIIDGTTYKDIVSPYTGDSTEGEHTYKVIAYDLAGWYTESKELTVIVDSQKPDIQITGTIPGIGFFIVSYSVSDPSPSSGFDKIVSSTDGYALCSGTFPTGFCTVFLGSELELTAYDKAGNEDTTSTTGTEKDIIPPTITYSSPSGVINSNTIILEVKTDEPSTCHYGSDDNNETMNLMTADVGKTTHTANLGTLIDGLKVYHVMCEDLAGNKIDSSKTIVFYIDTTESYNLVIPDYGHYWSTGWNSFFLPEDMLEDICGNGKPYTVEKILSSLDGSDPSYDVLWYFDGTEWLFYYPHGNGYSSLTEFNDKNSLPYYIRLVREDRLEISQANCLLSI